MIVPKPLNHPHAYAQEDVIIEIDDFDNAYVIRFVGGKNIWFPILRTLTNEQYVKLTEKYSRKR